VRAGSYLANYSPEGENGNGVVHWTPDIAETMTLATADAATAFYRAVP
jgi:hypothetical protein